MEHYDYLLHILQRLQDSLIAVAILLVFAAAVLIYAFLSFRKKHHSAKAFPWKKTLLIVLFLSYLIILLSATIGRKDSYRSSMNWQIFRMWIVAWNSFSLKSWLNLLINILLFIPLGSFLPLFSNRCKKLYFALPIGFGCSLWIELIQLLFSKGLFDVDDLFCNTLGTLIGYFFIMAVLSVAKKGKKQVGGFFLYGLLCILPFAMIGGIFLTYQLQEYGNFAEAPAYRVNTSNISWKLSCELSQARQTVSVYRMDEFTRADCDAFGLEFAQAIGADFDTITYSDGQTDFTDHSLKDGGHRLSVSLINKSFTYTRAKRDINDSPLWTSADQKTIERLLSGFPVEWPEDAEFQVIGNGWHCFEAKQLKTPQGFYDGSLKCRYSADGIIREMKGNLNFYCYYKDVDIISSGEAYALLCSGKFASALDFPVNAAEITVTGYRMEYRTDTKGFYRPVYIFTLECPQVDYFEEVVVFCDVDPGQ